MPVVEMASPEYRRDFICASTDTKPTENIPIGSAIYETDTKTWYMFDGSEWTAM